MEVDWGRKIHSSECMLSQVDSGAHETHTSCLFLCQEHTDHGGEPKDSFITGLWGGLPQGTFSTLSWSI